MRCKNCGWPNKPNEKTCVKCHAPLDQGEEESVESSIRSPKFSDSLQKTVSEQEIFGAGQKVSIVRDFVPSSDDTKPCPKCGYPVRPGTEKCPNCKFPINQSISVQTLRDDDVRNNVEEDVHTHPTRMNNPIGNGKFKGTINPYMMNMEMTPRFVLKPLKRLNERHDFNEQEYEGKEVVLNRDNTEQDNASITSHQQAIISQSDGHWFIEDKSELKTTFVQASQKIEVRDGDIILLGNRLFEFHK